MKILEVYLAGVVLLYTLIVMLVLLGLYFFTTLIGELGVVGQGSYRLLDAARYSAMLVPKQIYELFPMVALLGTMLGLGSLANSSELTVMRAAGVSIRGIAVIVAKLGLVMVIVVALLSEFVAPALEKQAHFQRMQAIERSVSFSTGSGLWVRDGDSYLTMEMLLPDGEALGLTRYQMDGQRLRAIATAQRGQYQDEAWHVEQVLITRFAPDQAQDQVQVLQLDSDQWISTLTPEVIDKAALPAENLSVRELAQFVGYLRENTLASERYEMAMWMRAFAPLATGGMILLALPFVFGSSRMLGMDRRILLGVLLGIGFYLFNGVFSRVGLLYELSPFISAATPTVLVYLLWFYLMRRVN
ncbi:MAG: LPS export ABC transporter permease LptG [Gammaproteobacteria bacterium]|nr:LPS export ABC transporter permease LptG [Gammaproteobacteria bacterium]